LREPELRSSGDSLFAFSTYLGQTTPVSATPGLFTQTLAANINSEGKRVIDVFEDTKSQVGSRSGGSQIPYVVNNILNQDFYFRAPKPQQRPTGFSATNKKDRLAYVYVHEGTFKMGCSPEDGRCEQNELPQHSVTITKNFWMGQTEVEVAAYRDRYLAQNKGVRSPAKPIWGWTTNHPIVNITRDEAEGYCKWAGGRLPTEAEWEYVARAGKDNEVYPLNNENSREKANFVGKKENDIFEVVAPVRSFDANDFNFFDLAGNVWEWVSDYYSSGYLASPAIDPTGPSDGKDYVARGGSFDSDPEKHLRLAYRHHYGKSANNIGFRCVLEDTSQTKQMLDLPASETSQRTTGPLNGK
jgi:formylglycine-generating enzyme required for sulfatase activity